MLEIISFIFIVTISIFSLILSIGQLSKKRNGNGANDKIIDKLKSQGMNPHSDDSTFKDNDDSYKLANLLMGVGGGYRLRRGDIDANNENSKAHELFHKAHHIEQVAPTKNLRKELYREWTERKDNLDKVSSELENLPENELKNHILEYTKYDTFNEALIDGINYGKGHINILRELSESYSKELNNLKNSDEYLKREKKFDLCNKEYESAFDVLIDEFLDKKGIKNEGQRLSVKESLKNQSTIGLLSIPKNILDPFTEFIEEYSDPIKIESLEEKSNRLDASLERFAEPMNRLKKRYNDYIKETVGDIIDGYAKNKEIGGKDKTPLSSQHSDDFTLLTENFAHYKDVTDRNTSWDRARDMLTTHYAKEDVKNKNDYGNLFDSLRYLHEGLKSNGSLNDEDAAKVILPLSKYFDAGEDLINFADNDNIKELSRYIKNNKYKIDLEESIGQYLGMKSLGNLDTRKYDRLQKNN